MDDNQNKDRQSGYDKSTFGPVGHDTYQKDSFGQDGNRTYHHDSYNYSQKYSGQQNPFGQTGSGRQYPPDGGAFYHSGEPPRGMGFGIASMVLGIIAIVLSCSCMNIPLAVIAVIFGIIHVCRHTGSNGFAIAGTVTAIVSVILTVILTVILYVTGITSSSWFYNEYLPFTDGIYDDDDIYDYDDYEDYFDGKDYEGVDF